MFAATCSAFDCPSSAALREEEGEAAAEAAKADGEGGGRRMHSRLRSSLRFGRDVVRVTGLSFGRQHVCDVCPQMLGSLRLWMD